MQTATDADIAAVRVLWEHSVFRVEEQLLTLRDAPVVAIVQPDAAGVLLHQTK
jgi:hypothetical protein